MLVTAAAAVPGHDSARRYLPLAARNRAGPTLLAANKRLNTAYLLKQSFGQLWDYEREGWAQRFFENWRDALKWQRLKPYEKFAEMRLGRCAIGCVACLPNW